jgi:hypothetical protein
MAIRVALIGTGNCGSLALKQLINDARFDLTAVWVSTAAKVGKDAGELAGLDVSTGVLDRSVAVRTGGHLPDDRAGTHDGNRGLRDL